MTLNHLVTESFRISKEHGFHTPTEGLGIIPEKLALVHSEVSEALEHYRDGNNGKPLSEVWLDAKGKPDGFAVELADIAIRVADLCGMLHIDFAEVVSRKMAYNESRPYKHGGKKC